MSESAQKSSKWSWLQWSVAGLVAVGLLAVAVPNFVKARATSCANACINNLRQIDAAANQFALEHQLATGTPIHFPNDLTPYIKLNSQGKVPECPASGIYEVHQVGQTPTCSLAFTVSGHALP